MQTMSWLSGAVVAMALASVLMLLARRQKSDAELLFAVFCASLASSMLRPALEGQPAWLLLALALGGCATCNVYWLVARALFRGEGGVQRQHVAIAVGIAALIVGHRIAVGSGLDARWPAVLGALLTMASSTVLLLAFVEALRGWSPALPRREKRLRIAFMWVYGGSVLSASTVGALAEAEPAWAPAYRIVVTVCALAILVFTHIALVLRRHRPLAQAEPTAASAALKPEDRALAQALVRLFEREAVYRQPELKVGDLARQLDSTEHKVSRAITQALGERNFNQLVNRYRIAHACRLLQASDRAQSVLQISAESGFASLGPFNRAFKAAMGCTPSAYRARYRDHAQCADAGDAGPHASAPDPAM
jgi:AraC-like DNA-binding protein